MADKNSVPIGLDPTSLHAKGNPGILNSIRSAAGDDYKNNVPQATQDNLAQVYTAIFSYTPAKNMFMAAMDKIGMTIIANKPVWTNPLKPFKRGDMPFGATVEELFVEMAEAKPFDQADAENTLYKRAYVKSFAAHHTINREEMMESTIDRSHWQRAFMNADGLANAVDEFVNALVRKDEWNEYLEFRQLLSTAVDDAKVVELDLGAVPSDAAGAKAFMKTVREYTTLLNFPSAAYNPAKVTTNSPIEDQVLIMTATSSANTDVELYSQAFNLPYTTAQQKVVVVDYIPIADDTKEVVAMLVDKSFFAIWDTLYETGEAWNAKGLYTNMFLHHHEIISVSPFANAIAFTAPVTP